MFRSFICPLFLTLFIRDSDATKVIFPVIYIQQKLIQLLVLNKLVVHRFLASLHHRYYWGVCESWL